MKILSTITYYAPYVSGLTICAQRVAESLVKRNHSVTVLAMQHTVDLSKKDNIDGVVVKRAPVSFSLSKGFLSIDWASLAWEEIKKTDVVAINMPQLEGVVAALFGRLQSKRVVGVYHCEVVLPVGVFNRVVQLLLDGIHILALLLCHQIIVYTDDYARASRILPYFAHKLTPILPPIPDLQVNDHDVRELKKDIGKNRDITIGLSSRLAREKGIEYILYAIKDIKKLIKGKSIMILMAGPLNPVGEEEYREEIFSLVEEYSDDIHFMGSLPQKKMGAFYSLLDVLVLPSVNATEAFGMVQVEAMRAGVPVVASNLPGVRVPVQKTGMGKIIPLRDSTALAEAVVDVVTHKKQYVKSKKEIEKLFSFERSIDAYEKVFSG